MENLNKKQIIIIVIISLIILIVVGYYIITNFQKINYENLDDMEITEENNIEISNATEKIEDNIVVHVAGAVMQEGIVTL